VNPTSANNRLPETYTGQAPLTLLPGSGPLAGKRISGLSGEPYGDLSLHSIHDLDGYAEMSPEWYMYHSSGGRYKANALDGLDLAVEIVSMTPGLKLGLDGLSDAGQQLAVGGESNLPAELLFWTEGDAALGTYVAQLQLVDRSGTFASSGTFNIDFAVIPEPTTAALGALTLVGAGLRRRRRTLGA
jgi:MYXO-CTERM domain-containing protein